MWILPLVGYLGYVVGFIMLTLSIASGLYYLSELVEEHTVVAKRLLTRLIYFIMGLMILLWIVDGFPFWQTLLGIGSHAVYLGNMRRFPFVRMSDPLFLASCVLVLLNHWAWMRYFSYVQQTAYNRMSSYYERPNVPSFVEVASYFGLCVWVVPFVLFISLSAGENVLPTIGTEDFTGGGGAGVDHGGRSKDKRQGLVKSLMDSVTGTIGQVWGPAKGRDKGF
jgi:hypothetical protein